VREGDSPPIATRIDPADPRTVVDAVAEELAALGGGRLAVIVSREDRDGIVKLLTEGLPDGSVSVGQDALDSSVAVLTVAGVKGLEFDTVVLLEPAAILRESSRGANDLYVAVTRPTQRLRVLHGEPLPPGLDSMISR
jgi:DNA helicase IV